MTKNGYFFTDATEPDRTNSSLINKNRIPGIWISRLIRLRLILANLRYAVILMFGKMVDFLKEMVDYYAGMIKNIQDQ